MRLHYRGRVVLRWPIPAVSDSWISGRTESFSSPRELSTVGFVVSSSNGGKRSVTFPGLTQQFGRAVSGDGKMILFEEEGNEARHSTVFIRNVDGSPQSLSAKDMAWPYRPTRIGRWLENNSADPGGTAAAQ